VSDRIGGVGGGEHAAACPAGGANGKGSV
jgi:hypothetical protein